ncbi:SGNH hydrolase-type esterase domain containing protein [Trema orientale]|uniref:SGNH hydrolase-type esterase domain containing protein n=1 Tax=Trema orientale TaxID=63057 RepID=A0A2P5CNB5_TREOI|nr:SGNH hydrolase-type esterase domain containing protein [Trema orientale]
MAKSISFSRSLFILSINLTILALISTTCNAALFILGDSAFDAGNNNYINTSFQANYFPYGETFFKYPTGRFSDGRLAPDFIAEYAKLPFIPPYLQPHEHEFKYGVNFASAGAGALVETRRGLVVDLKTQLGYFKNVSQLLRQKKGDAEAADLLARAVYLFSVGGNDYAFAFETNSSVLRTYSPQQFVGLVIGNITTVIQVLLGSEISLLISYMINIINYVLTHINK